MFKKIKSIFVVDEGTEADPTSTVDVGEVSAPSAVSSPSASNTTTSPTPTVAISSDKVDQKFVDILLKAIEANNIQGFDYLEFKQALQNLNSVSMDDTTKYQSALAMSKTMGADAAKIVQSAEHYLSILKSEESKFYEALKGQKAKVMQDQDSGLKLLQQSIADKKKQIELLTTSIAQEEAKLVDMQQNIANSEQKLVTTKSQFDNAYNLVSLQIKQDIDKIKSVAK